MKATAALAKDGGATVRSKRATATGGPMVFGASRTVPDSGRPRAAAKAVTGRHDGEIGTTGGHRGSPGRYTIQEMLRLQGMPEDALDEAPFTAQGKRRLVGNGVPLSMGRALARAVRMATE